MVPVCQTQAAQFRPADGNLTEDSDRKNDDVIRTCVAEKDDVITLEVQVMKGELGLGFCIEGGKGSPDGDRPVSVKRLFLGTVFFTFYWFISQQVGPYIS